MTSPTNMAVGRGREDRKRIFLGKETHTLIGFLLRAPKIRAFMFDLMSYSSKSNQTEK